MDPKYINPVGLAVSVQCAVGHAWMKRELKIYALFSAFSSQRSMLPTTLRSVNRMSTGYNDLASASNATVTNPSLSRVRRENIVAFEERTIDSKKVKVVRLVRPFFYHSFLSPWSEMNRFSLQDCDRGTAKCIEIVCQVRELNRYQPVVIRLRARLWNSTFLEVGVVFFYSSLSMF